MFKVLWLLKPVAGVSHQDFRDWYENSHAPLAERYFGHLLLEYRRNYVDEVVGAVPGDYIAGVEGTPNETAAIQARAFDFAVVAEWVMADEASFGEIMSIFADPDIGPLFRADSEGTMHPDTVLVKVTAHETESVGGAAPEGLS